MAVVANVVRARTTRNRTQTYIAILLDVTAGCIGQIESQNFPSKYTLDQLNKIALDFECSLKDSMPEEAING